MVLQHLVERMSEVRRPALVLRLVRAASYSTVVRIRRHLIEACQGSALACRDGNQIPQTRERSFMVGGFGSP